MGNADMATGSTERNGEVIRKVVLCVLGLALLGTSGVSFYRHRHLEEPVVLSEGVSEVKQLSDYFEGIRGTVNDCNVYVFEGEEPGGTMMVIGGELAAGLLWLWHTRILGQLRQST